MKKVFRIFLFAMIIITGCQRQTPIYSNAFPGKEYTPDPNHTYRGYNQNKERDKYWSYERDDVKTIQPEMDLFTPYKTSPAK